MTERQNNGFKTIVVNCVAGPGAGKSTLAAATFAKLKMLGVNCELVTEFAKDKTWENNSVALSNQLYVFSKQYFRMDRCSGKVDVLITDSPLFISPIYNRDPDIEKPLKDLVVAINAKYRNLYYYIRRVKKYNPIGRSQTEKEADDIGSRLKTFLDIDRIPYREVPGCVESADIIISDVIKLLDGRLADTSDMENLTEKPETV